MGKVAASAPSIMAALYGSKGRKETREWAEMCAERSVAARQTRSLQEAPKTTRPRPKV